MRTDEQQSKWLMAEIVDDADTKEAIPEYDQKQIQQTIEATDQYVAAIRHVGGSMALVGVQMTTTQALYLLGATGWFPAVVAGIPVSAGIASCLMADSKGKLAIAVGRCSLLAMSSVKLNGDARTMNSIAVEGTNAYTEQVRAYEGKQLESPNFGVTLILSALILTVGLLFIARKSG